MSSAKISPLSNKTNRWQRWCRLCSHSKTNNINYSNDESLTNAIQRYFRIKLTKHEKESFYLCDECHALLKAMIKFTDIANDVQKMFQHLHKSAENANLSSIRSEFGFHENDGNSFKKLFEEELSSSCDITEITVKDENLEFNEDATDGSNITIENNDQFSETSTPKTVVNIGENRKSKSTEHLDTSINRNQGHQCHYCFKYFKRKYNRDLHIKKIHIKQAANNGQPEKPFQCEICQRRFRYEARLKNHMPTHDPHRFVCDQCGREYSSRKNLNNHILMHYEKTLKNTCDYCGKTFQRSKTLQVHLILHKGSPLPQKPITVIHNRPRRHKLCLKE